MIDADRLRSAYRTARDTLLAERTPDGHWVGELSSSALSTATAVTALAVVARSAGPNPEHERLIDDGLGWLGEHQNADGGWGDTVKSLSNISTTMLCRAAFPATGRAQQYGQSLRRCEEWLGHYGRTPAELAEAVRRRYGKDRTFSVPILMMCALAGLVPWREVPRLPFELACLPQSFYRWARMPVVSYALPALIAIGQVVHHHRSTWNPVTRLLRWLGRGRSLRVLERIQPSSGGYLEATPLTSFVVMSLGAMRPLPPRPPLPEAGRGGADAHAARVPLTGSLPPRFGEGGLGGERSADHVLARGVEFIVNSARPDGSWPIDTNLSVWVTTLSVNALAAAGDLASLDRRDELLAWLLAQQTKEVHPYTGAAPGAWAWSDEPGSVPDCDDTPGAVLAVNHLNRSLPAAKRLSWTESEKSQRGAVTVSTFVSSSFGRALQLSAFWMAGLQNRDGGWPTFCRGWGKLPFDRSGCDLTAHVLRTCPICEYVECSPVKLITDKFARHAERGFAYLARQQRPDGSWLPLWFGNQHAPDDINPVYGTSRVLAAYRDLGRADTDEARRGMAYLFGDQNRAGGTDEARRGVAYLLGVQNPDGGWGGAKGTPSSVEETAQAVEVLLDLAPPEARPAVERGIEYLVRRVEDGTFTDPSPIGFYFAKLWYFEKLYPVIFTVAALGRAVRRLA